MQHFNDSINLNHNKSSTVSHSRSLYHRAIPRTILFYPIHLVYPFQCQCRRRSPFKTISSLCLFWTLDGCWCSATITLSLLSANRSILHFSHVWWGFGHSSGTESWLASIKLIDPFRSLLPNQELLEYLRSARAELELGQISDNAQTI